MGADPEQGNVTWPLGLNLIAAELLFLPALKQNPRNQLLQELAAKARKSTGFPSARF